ncbi:MAG TPA: hypothetical protein VGQ59_11885 [Cyclobacteriaceae bacterium]|jgi:hypothetical protein|nr:hypothetical protein [Cyclobacteriaceae bacterium]
MEELNTRISVSPFDREKLISVLGFELEEDFDKDFESDVNYTLKVCTYTKPIIGDFKIVITEEYSPVKTNEWKFDKAYVELAIGFEYQKLELNDMYSLIDLMQKLSPAK